MVRFAGSASESPRTWRGLGRARAGRQLSTALHTRRRAELLPGGGRAGEKGRIMHGSGGHRQLAGLGLHGWQGPPGALQICPTRARPRGCGHPDRLLGHLPLRPAPDLQRMGQLELPNGSRASPSALPCGSRCHSHVLPEQLVLPILLHLPASVPDDIFAQQE